MLPATVQIPTCGKNSASHANGTAQAQMQGFPRGPFGVYDAALFRPEPWRALSQGRLNWKSIFTGLAAPRPTPPHRDTTGHPDLETCARNRRRPNRAPIFIRAMVSTRHADDRL